MVKYRPNFGIINIKEHGKQRLYMVGRPARRTDLEFVSPIRIEEGIGATRP